MRRHEKEEKIIMKDTQGQQIDRWNFYGTEGKSLWCGISQAVILKGKNTETVTENCGRQDTLNRKGEVIKSERTVRLRHPERRCWNGFCACVNKSAEILSLKCVQSNQQFKWPEQICGWRGLCWFCKWEHGQALSRLSRSPPYYQDRETHSSVRRSLHMLTQEVWE